MQRRWLRNNPFLPGNPVGRGVALLQELETVGAKARTQASRHWRRARSRGLTTNQLAHLQGQLAVWNQLPAEEQQQVETRLSAEAGFPAEVIADLRKAALLERWSQRVRETNNTLSAVEAHLQERRAHLARVEELRERGAPPGLLRQAESAAAGAAEELQALTARCNDLQTALIRELLEEGVDLFPDFMWRLVEDGIFLPEDVRDFRGFNDLALALEDSPPE